jgi:hypothetical protein
LETRYAFMLGIPMNGGLIMGDIKPEGIQRDVRLVVFTQSTK